MDKYDESQEIEFNQIRTYGTYKPQWFINSSNLEDGQIWEINMQHKYVGKPWLIAYDYYKNQYLDWIIIQFDKNEIDELFGWPTMEDRVFLPSPDVVLSEA